MNAPATRGDREAGAVLVITAFIFIALLGIAALVIDIVMVHQAKIRAQATVDASVLAAAFDITDIEAATAAAKEYATRNYGVAESDWDACVDPEPLAVATSVSCISIDDEEDPTRIRVRLPDRSVPSFFASVLGRDGFDVSAAAVAEVEYTVEGGAAAPGADPDADSVRNGWAGGWVTTAPGADNFGEGCAEDFWDVEPPPDDGDGKKKKGNDEWREYVFVFEHTDGTVVVWCDTNRYGRYTGQIDMYGNEIGGAKETLLPGGTNTDEPYDMALAHVSCSGNWLSGWSTKDHPTAEDDPEWRVVYYRLDKRKGDGEVFGDDFIPCEHALFGAIYADEPVIEPIIRLYD